MTDIERIRLDEEVALKLWYRALETEFGIAFTLQDPDTDQKTVEKIMYDTRNRTGDPLLDDLKLVRLKDESEVWIVRRTQDRLD